MQYDVYLKPPTSSHFGKATLLNFLSTLHGSECGESSFHRYRNFLQKNRNYRLPTDKYHSNKNMRVKDYKE